MTLLPPIMIGVINTQKMSYKKHSGSRMHATCNSMAPSFLPEQGHTLLLERTLLVLSLNHSDLACLAV